MQASAEQQWGVQVERLEQHRMLCWQALVDTLLVQYAPTGGSPRASFTDAAGDVAPLQQLRGAQLPCQRPSFCFVFGARSHRTSLAARSWW